MLEKLFKLSIILEVILFPWINESSLINSLFVVLFSVNLFISILQFIAKNARQKYDSWKVVFILFIFLLLINPGTYWQEFTIESAAFRLLAFGLRFIFFHKIYRVLSSPLFTFGVFISCLMAVLGWLQGGGDAWRLNYPYGDANYQGFIFASYIFIILIPWDSASTLHRQLIRIASISCFLIVVLGASRGSIIALVFVVALWILVRFKLWIKTVILLSILTSAIIVSKSPYSKEIVVIQRLFNPRSSDKGAANSRLLEIESAQKAMISDPETIIFGNGLSSSANKSETSYTHNFRIHNTTMSIIYDSGILGVLLVAISIVLNFLKLRNSVSVYLFLFILLNSQTFFVLTFYQFYLCLGVLERKENYI